MNLYVWEDVLYGYTSGIMFAIASSAKEARELLLAKCPYILEEDINRHPLVYPVNQSYANLKWG